MTKKPFDFQMELAFSGDALAELDRSLTLLLSTREGTLPLNREFGINMDFLDLPPETAKSLYTAEITKKVAKFIPSVRVQEVRWSAGDDGQLKSRVVITSA